MTQRRTILLLAVGGWLLAAGAGLAADLTLVTSGGYTAAYRRLAPQAQAATGDTIALELGASMGATTTAIPNRLKRGEAVDLVIMVDYALDDLIKAGLVAPGSKVELARSRIAMAVKAGAPKPDIGTVDALRRTLLAAKSIAYSDSASGTYLAKELFPRLGIADQIKDKTHMVDATRLVGETVASGEYEIGFQQLSELKPVAGIDIVGPIPDAAQLTTIYSAGVPTASKHPAEAAAVVRFLHTPAAARVVAETGLDPIP